jgi:hypothetical protein
VVDDGRAVRSNVVASQTDFHRKFGGVVPEIASRAHIEALDSVIEEALAVAGEWAPEEAEPKACLLHELDDCAVLTVDRDGRRPIA